MNGMPGLGGAEVVAAVRAEFPAAQIIIVTTYDTDEDLYQAVRAGARGYLLKDTSLGKFTDCIRRVSRGETRVPEALLARLAGRVGAAELSPRELEVLRNAKQPGHADEQVGEILTYAQELRCRFIISCCPITPRPPPESDGFRRWRVSD
jgi:two-component system, NarL family, response regulator